MRWTLKIHGLVEEKQPFRGSIVRVPREFYRRVTLLGFVEQWTTLRLEDNGVEDLNSVLPGRCSCVPFRAAWTS